MLTFFCIHSLLLLDILDHHKKGLTVWLWSSFIPSHRLRSIQRTGAETSKRLTEESRELKMLEQYGNIAFTFHRLATSNCKQNVHICTPSCLARFGWSYVFKFFTCFLLGSPRGVLFLSPMQRWEELNSVTATLHAMREEENESASGSSLAPALTIKTVWAQSSTYQICSYFYCLFSFRAKTDI